MSGILDKKSRFIDYILTENGRSQIQDNDIRFYYATFSDKSIVYKEKDITSVDDKINISEEKLYLPFESFSSECDYINSEFDLKKEISFDDDTNINLTQRDISFDNAVTEVSSNSSIGEKLININYLETRRPSKKTGISFVDSDTIVKKDSFKILNNPGKKYPTINKKNIELEKINSITTDKRFSRKTNFKRLIPENIDGRKLYDEIDTNFYFEKEVNENLVLKSYNKDIDINENNIAEEAILKTINSLMNNKDIDKKVYEVSNSNKDDMYILSMSEFFEKTSGDSKELEKNKLHFIDLGEVYDKSNGKTKQVYLIGKIINTKNYDNIENDIVFNFNNGTIQSNIINKSFIISNYYSFLCMFTLIAE